MSDNRQADRSVTTIQRPKRGNKPRQMPRYKVVLLDDEVNQFGVVVEQVHRLTPLNHEEAMERTTEAHETGRSLLLVTHKERAELYQEQFRSMVPPIGIEIEPDA